MAGIADVVRHRLAHQYYYCLQPHNQTFATGFVTSGAKHIDTTACLHAVARRRNLQTRKPGSMNNASVWQHYTIFRRFGSGNWQKWSGFPLG